MKNWIIAFTLIFLGHAAHAQQPAVAPMEEFEKNGFSLAGAEYWPFTGDGSSFHYPDSVLWGFTDNGTTPAAQACARKAYDKLSAFLAAPSTDLLKLKELGATTGFFLWTNDYSTANSGIRMRSNRIWHWSSEGVSFADGLWKWESVVTPSGECKIPEDAQIAQMLHDTVVRIQAHGLAE